MQASCLYSSSLPPLRSRRTPGGSAVYAARRSDSYNENHYKGRLVDQNMVVLRKRIREMKVEKETHAPPPEKWMEWEKRWYYDGDYVSAGVYEFLGYLQVWVMDARPSLVLGTAALVLISLSTSMASVLIYFALVINGIV